MMMNSINIYIVKVFRRLKIVNYQSILSCKLKKVVVNFQIKITMKKKKKNNKRK